MKTLVIRELLRQPEADTEDRLRFDVGVNVIVGPPNSGKSKWLRMLDYLMGDDSTPEALFDDLAEKYNLVQTTLEIAAEAFVVERKWKEPGLRTKVIVNGEAMSLKDYREWLLAKLGIPLIRYPKGNPYGPTAWPELGWRSLYRHVYRRQTFWSDLSPTSSLPESNTPACCNSSDWRLSSIPISTASWLRIRRK